MADLQVVPQKQADIAPAQIAKILKAALPDIEKKSGAQFNGMCIGLAEFANAHADFDRGFLKETLQANKDAIAQFFSDKQKEFPSANPEEIFTAVVAAVAVGSTYHMDPLRLLVLIPGESGFRTTAQHANTDDSMDLGLYQINSRWNPEETYRLDPGYELQQFNQVLAARGAPVLRTFPFGVWDTNPVRNTAGAALTLLEKMRKAKDWQKIYTAYNGSLDNPTAMRYGRKMEHDYQKEKDRYRFVLPPEKRLAIR